MIAGQKDYQRIFCMRRNVLHTIDMEKRRMKGENDGIKKVKMTE